MKKIKQVALICFVLFCTIVNAQITTKIDTIQNVDNLIKSLDKKSFNSGILYDRVFSIAKLNSFNNTNNISSLRHFEQSLSELYRASNKSKFISVSDFRKKYTSIVIKNSVDIGIINTTFNSLNYNEKRNNKGALRLTNGKLTVINTKPVFIDKHLLVISPLKKYAIGQTITYNFKNELLLQESNQKIVKLEAAFGTGTKHTIIDNSTLTKTSVNIQYTSSGYKTLTFIATFNNGTQITTKGKLYVTVTNQNFVRGVLEGTEDGIMIATIPFTGYETGDTPILGQLEYRIFFHGTSGNYAQNILKPIIIIDGFDPFDKRQIEESDYPNDGEEHPKAIETLMTYKNQNGISLPLIKELRLRGFDVIIVNHPVYDTPNDETIDGGADYIERNAMAHIALYQHLNNRVFNNGSNEELIIMGPSMGGQISRYALAYMEEHNLDHNTKLWVSIDSPHLGANILVAGQANLYFLGYIHGDQTAKDQYDFLLNSPAGKQQLLVQHSHNSTSLPPYFQQYHTNLESNLSNFDGFPQIPRSIAIVNGSLSKNVNSPGQKVLDVRGFTDVLWFTLKSFQNEEWFMKGAGERNKIFYGKVNKIFSSYSMTTHFTNPLAYGSLDALQGGMADTQGEIMTPLVEGLEDNDDIDDVDVRLYIPNHAFIPTVSGLAFKNSNFNWSDDIDRNLVCTDEIPFDTYYAPKENENHIYFTQKSVNWLFEELNGNYQEPTVYLTHGNLQGPTTICSTVNKTYSFDQCKLGSTPTWQVSSNLQIISSTDFSITVRAINSLIIGEAYIKAIIGGDSVTKNIFIGTPISSSEIDNNILTDGDNNIKVELIGANNERLQWRVNGVIVNDNGGYWVSIYFNDYPCINNQIILSMRKNGACGWSNWASINYTECEEEDFFWFSTNPMKSGSSANKAIIIDKDYDKNIDYTISIFNKYGNKVYSQTHKNKEFNITSLQEGFYIVQFQTKKGVMATKKLMVD